MSAPVFAPGTAIRIAVPVTSASSTAARAFVRVRIHEGSIWPSPGDVIAEYSSVEQLVSPGETVEFIVEHSTVAGSIDRRDLAVEMYYWDGAGWVKGADGVFQDAYYVRAEYRFTIGQPTVGLAS